MTAVGRFKARPCGLFSRGRGGWLAILATVLVAFSWQSFVTQTHRHFDNESFSSAPDAAQNSDRKAPSGLPHDCPMCRAIAHAGQFVLPAAFVFEAPVPPVFWRADPALLRLAVGQRSHAWRSRAPPYQLQT